MTLELHSWQFLNLYNACNVTYKWMDSNDIMVVVDKNVIVPHYHHLTSKMAGLSMIIE